MKGALECLMQANNNSALSSWSIGLGTPNSRSEPSSEFQRQETVAPTPGSDDDETTRPISVRLKPSAKLLVFSAVLCWFLKEIKWRPY